MLLVTLSLLLRAVGRKFTAARRDGVQCRWSLADFSVLTWRLYAGRSTRLFCHDWIRLLFSGVADLLLRIHEVGDVSGLQDDLRINQRSTRSMVFTVE